MELYFAEMSYDQSMLLQPTYSSILAQMSDSIDSDDDDEQKLRFFAMEGPIRPEYPYSFSEYSSLTSEFSSMVATMSPEVQEFFSSVASDKASIESKVSRYFHTNVTSSGRKQLATATLTGKKNSASGKEVLGSGVLAIGFIVITLLL
jgi:hypothetical protein